MVNVCIVGVGLIGGSLGMALRRVREGGRRIYRVSGFGRSKARLKKARRLGAIDAFSTSAAAVVPAADIIVLCVPVQGIAPLAKEILPHVKPGAVLTDVGSVKKRVVDELRRALARRPDVDFVGAHPIAGSEKTGVEFARRDLYADAVCAVMTGARPAARRAVRSMWSRAGARCVTLTPENHDKFLALTSHLPHIISFAYFSLVHDAAKKNPMIHSLVAGSFRDMTRVAGADPDLWTGVVDSNRKELACATSEFARAVGGLVRASNKNLRRSIEQLALAKRRW